MAWIRTLLSIGLLVVLLLRMAVIWGNGWVYVAITVVAGATFAGAGLWRLSVLRSLGARAGNRPPRRVLFTTLACLLVLAAVGVALGVASPS